MLQMDIEDSLQNNIVGGKRPNFFGYVPLDQQESTEVLNNADAKLNSNSKFNVSRKVVFLLINTIVLAVLLSVDIFGEGSKNRCFAVLIFASLMWASEALPLYVTSMCVPFLLVVLRVPVKQVLESDQQGWITVAMTANEAAKFVFSKMWAPVIMLLLGGFTIASAMSKYGLAKRLAVFILSRAGTKSWAVLLAIMFVSWFMSMWISNVAAPVLCFSIMEPVLKSLDSGNTFAISLVMGIALSANIGGLTTPISSPQNAIALYYMDPPVSWFKWLCVSIPISLLSLFTCWSMLLLTYQPHKSTPLVEPINSAMEPLTKKHYFILGVSLSTIALWCLESTLNAYIGNSGVIAIIPMVLFFGSGILNQHDFNTFLWSVIMLAMGGMSLGSVVENTSLLKVIGTSISETMVDHDLLVVLIAFSAFVLVVATFISHTVSALILLPLVQAVGKTLPGDHANLLVFGCAIMCSGAMGLPISGFPNITAISIESVGGRPFVKTKDFLKVGIPISVIVLLITVTVGYGIMLGLGL
ncbi:hypothetical protein MP228_012735 [Amoeboaphelidium protococcarum]|nr:hypothetical protein MP228_012735 [Amoeboaphelidium protococcarum]